MNSKAKKWVKSELGIIHNFQDPCAPLDIGRGNTPMFAIITPHSARLNLTSKITIMQQRVASVWASIAKD